jgi:hypothetical protein
MKGSARDLSARKHPFQPQVRGVAQPGRAPGSGPGGRRFESSLPDHLKLKNHSFTASFAFLGSQKVTTALLTPSAGAVFFEQLLRRLRRRIPDSRAAIAPGRKPVGPDRHKAIGTDAIGILSPCLGHVHAVTALNFPSSPGPKVVRDRSAVTGRRKKSVKVSAAGHAKSRDLSSLVDPEGSEQM